MCGKSMKVIHHKNLPHWQKPGAAFFVTWRLAGSLPNLKIDHLESESERFAAVDRLLDTDPRGLCWMQQPEVADVVTRIIVEGEQRQRYELGHWVVMPNHVHMILRPNADLSSTMRQLKAISAREANTLLNRTGKSFWERDYFDRYIRTRVEEARIASCIERNPAKAGLSEWRWHGVGQNSPSAAPAAAPIHFPHTLD